MTNGLKTSMSLVTFVRKIISLVEWQRHLVAAFRSTNPNVQDFKMLTDCPRGGSIHLDGFEWQWRRHGYGIWFENVKEATVVDIESNLLDTHFVGAQRLSLILKSQRQALSFDECLDMLRSLEWWSLARREHPKFQLTWRASVLTWLPWLK